MSAVFKDRSLHKYYRCVVKGRVTEKQVITGFLKKDEATNQVTVTTTETAGSVPIMTEYEPLGWAEDCTLLSVKLITGRTHQIRAHLASIGHPILGDYKYGDSAVNEEAVTFPELPEPLTGLSGKTFSAPLPQTFRKICRDWS